jgi:hypothetical protein
VIFRFVPKRGGAHVHIAVFMAPAIDQTFAKMGDLVLHGGSEWEAFRSLLIHGGGGDERGDGSINVEATDQTHEQ